VSSSLVLDLPALYTHPTARELLEVLQSLRATPITFETSDGPDTVDLERPGPSNGVAAYLTRIVASGLAWIEDEASREAVWEAASARLAERAGVTGEIIACAFTPDDRDFLGVC